MHILLLQVDLSRQHNVEQIWNIEGLASSNNPSDLRFRAEKSE